MTDKNYTAICLLIDASGSMMAIKDATEQGINSYIKEQAASDGRRTIRIMTFETDNTDLNGLKTFCPTIDAWETPRFTLKPGGGTALLDAMANSIKDFGAELAALPEATRPGYVVFVIMTDGLENSSRYYTQDEVREIIKHQEEKYNWKFLYLGANQDAIAVAGGLGINRNSSMTYDSNPHSVIETYNVASSYTGQTASGAMPSVTEEQRKKTRNK